MLWEACSLYEPETGGIEYYDRKSNLPKDEYISLLHNSKTLYIGNIAPSVGEEALLSVLDMAAPLGRLIMGVHKKSFAPCGFCFAEYKSREDAVVAHRQLNGFELHGRLLKADFDIGFKEGRQYGRGFEGGQVMDEIERAKRDQARRETSQQHKRSKQE